MVSPPRMPKLNSNAVVAHYKALADAVDLPIVVQDYPPITGFAMEPALLARIAKEIPSARTIKLEDPPTPFKTARILEAAGGTTVQIFGGLGGVFLLEELISGATGAMTGFAFPEILVRIMKHWNAGEHDAAADVFYRAVPLMRFEFQEGIGMAIRKEVLRRRGALASAATRAPAGGARRADEAGARPRADVGHDTERHGMDLGLKGKVAMVGGASRGLGYAVAEALAREGASVSISSSNQASIDEAAKRISAGGAHGARRRPWTCATAIRSRRGRQKTIERFGGIDLLFTNGGGPPSGAAVSFDDAAWQNAIDLLLFSALRMVRAAVPSMKQRGGGAILMSTSASVKEPIAEPRALDGASRVGLGAGEDAGASSSPPTRSASTRSSPAASTPIASSSSTRSPARSRGSAPTRRRRSRSAAIPLARYGETRRVRPRRGVHPVRRRVVHDRRDRAGRRRADQERAVEVARLEAGGCRDPGLQGRISDSALGDSTSMSVMRKVLLAMSTSTFLREQATKRAFVRRSVSAFMPGEKVEDALGAAAALKPQRINTILTRLGEGVTKLDEAERVTQHYLDVLDKVKAAGLDAQISVKPTQLGLDLDAEQCQRNLDRICEKAERLGNVPVWIDMENSPYVDPTLKLFRKSKERYKGVGIAIQAYLYRTAEGHREADPARSRHPHRQGGLPRTARRRVPEEVRRRRELLQHCACG